MESVGHLRVWDSTSSLSVWKVFRVGHGPALKTVDTDSNRVWFDSTAFRAILNNMRCVLLLLCMLLSGCGAVPTTGGVLHHNSCPLTWEPQDFPLSVVVDTRLSGNQQAALIESVQAWNIAVGANVFTITREVEWFSTELLSPQTQTVYVLLSDLSNAGYLVQGLASLEAQDCHIQYVRVFIDLDVPDSDASLVLIHELGHSLGLSHDRWQPSIMWQYANSSGGRIMPDDVNFIQWELTHGNQRNPSLSQQQTDGRR